MQGNPGGYLEAAEQIADEFIIENKVIVSQKGKAGKYNDDFKSTDKGIFETQPIIVLIDEYLQGSYDGIGIEFDVINDSITVVKPTLGGPSDKAGLTA